jgi:hypothetical protein
MCGNGAHPQLLGCLMGNTMQPGRCLECQKFLKKIVESGNILSYFVTV